MGRKQPRKVLLDSAAESWRRSLVAEGKSPKTVSTYLEAVRLLGSFLGQETTVQNVTRMEIQVFTADQLERFKPYTALNRFRGLRGFFSWLEREEEIAKSPVWGVRQPSVPDEPPPIYSEQDLRLILKRCSGSDFRSRRRNAMIRILLDTGMRRAELTGLNLDDVDFVNHVLHVVGKGSRPRLCPVGDKAVLSLDRYIRERSRHRYAKAEGLWVGERGRLRASSVFHDLVQLAEEAGVEGAFVHRFRHTFADAFLRAGGQEGDLCRLAGWRCRAMVDRYGRSAADARAREAHARIAPGDRI